MAPLETALRRGFIWLLPGLAISVPLLAVPEPDDPLWLFIIHLTLLVGYGIALAIWLAPLVRNPGWFTGLSGRRKGWAAAASIVIIATGVTALVTLASSAALRFDVSLQFLQLLSALDIAWAGAALVVGAYLLWGRGASIWAGITLAVFCVYSIWRYLDLVGFTDSNGWVVSGRDLMVNVIPFDMVAAAVALITLAYGLRRLQLMEQPRVQS